MDESTERRLRELNEAAKKGTLDESQKRTKERIDKIEQDAHKLWIELVEEPKKALLSKPRKALAPRRGKYWGEVIEASTLEELLDAGGFVLSDEQIAHLNRKDKPTDSIYNTPSGMEAGYANEDLGYHWYIRFDMSRGFWKIVFNENTKKWIALWH